MKGLISTILFSTLVVTSISGQISVSFVSDTVCFGSATQLNSTSTTGTGNIIAQSWDLNNNGQFNNATGASIAFTFSSADTHTVGLKVKTDMGDSATAYATVIVRGMPNSALGAVGTCFGDFTNFFNLSTIPEGTTPSYRWDLGDNNIWLVEKPTHLYADTGTYNLELIVTTDGECSDTSTGTVDVWSLPTVEILTNDDLQFCVSDSIQLNANVIGTTNYFWSTGESSESIKVKTEGLFYLVAIDSNGCTDRDSINTTTLSLPVLSTSNDTTVVIGEKAVLRVSGASEYAWSPSSSLDASTGATVNATPNQQTRYTVIATDASGCVDSAHITVNVWENYFIDANNLFSPNGDGVNDVWIVNNISHFAECTFSIFNKWGDEVYNTNNYNNDWDGTRDGKNLPEDTYYYVTSCDNESKSFSGSITILR